MVPCMAHPIGIEYCIVARWVSMSHYNDPREEEQLGWVAKTLHDYNDRRRRTEYQFRKYNSGQSAGTPGRDKLETRLKKDPDDRHAYRRTKGCQKSYLVRVELKLGTVTLCIA